MAHRLHVIVVRPEPLRWNVAAGLAGAYRVEVVDDPFAAAVRRPDVVLLVGGPDQRTLGWCQRLASGGTPVIAVSLVAEPAAELAFLEAGADDVVLATIRPPLLAARIQVQQRHRSALDPRRGRLEIGALRIDPSTYEVAISGEPLNLQPSVFQILHALAFNAGNVMSTRALYKAAGHEELDDGHGNAIRIAISRLRHALGNRPDVPRIETVRLVGYRLKPPAAVGAAGVFASNHPLTGR